MTDDDILDYAAEHSGLLSQDDVYLGGWLDEGYGYLDVSINIQNLDEALALAKKNHQLAIYDVVTGESIYIGEDKDEND